MMRKIPSKNHDLELDREYGRDFFADLKMLNKSESEKLSKIDQVNS